MPMLMTLERMATIINDHPIGVRNLDEEVTVPVTPNMLPLGKASTATDCMTNYDM